MAKIKKVIENGGIQYPATITDAVKNPNNGKTVTEELSELGSKVDDIGGRFGKTLVSDSSLCDLDFTDKGKNAIVQFKDGHIKTKNFDSREIATPSKNGLMSKEDKKKIDDVLPLKHKIVESVYYDLVLSDNNNIAIVQFKDGHIKTKNFDSREITTTRKIIERDIYALGDSTTFGAGSGETSSSGNKSWFDRLTQKIKFTSATKLAINGSTAMYKEGLPRLSNQIDNLPLNGNPIVLVMIGTNDSNSGNMLGAYDEAMNADYDSLDDTATFANSYRYCMETIKRRLPHAELLAMMPLTPQYDNENGTESFREMERKICKALSIPVIEVRDECGITKFCNFGYAQVSEDDVETATVFMADELHPNNAGYERIANYMVGKLNYLTK